MSMQMSISAQHLDFMFKFRRLVTFGLQNGNSVGHCLWLTRRHFSLPACPLFVPGGLDPWGKNGGGGVLWAAPGQGKQRSPAPPASLQIHPSRIPLGCEGSRIISLSFVLFLFSLHVAPLLTLTRCHCQPEQQLTLTSGAIFPTANSGHCLLSFLSRKPRSCSAQSPKGQYPKWEHVA